MRICPLCGSEENAHFYQDKKRDYWRCQQCALVFVDAVFHLNPDEEKAVYDLHENNPHDEGYQRFLSRLVEPLAKRLPRHAKGLDFGCGAGSALPLLMKQQGHAMRLYDVYFFPDKAPLSEQYDFLTATEVIEHLCSPKNEWQQWLNLVKPGGWIGLMTKMVIDLEAFARWHYKHDPTHVSFFSRETFQYLAERDNLELEFVGNDVILLRKRH